MESTLTVLSSELRIGDVVHCHGMDCLIDRPVQSSDRGPYAPVYWSSALVVNVDNVGDEWLVNITRQYEAWPNRHVPTGEHRWGVQGNDNVRWSVTRCL